MIKVGDKVSWTEDWFSNDNDIIHLAREVADDDNIVIVCSCDRIPQDCLKKHDNEKVITCKDCLERLANM